MITQTDRSAFRPFIKREPRFQPALTPADFQRAQELIAEKDIVVEDVAVWFKRDVKFVRREPWFIRAVAEWTR